MKVNIVMQPGICCQAWRFKFPWLRKLGIYLQLAKQVVGRDMSNASYSKFQAAVTPSMKLINLLSKSTDPASRAWCSGFKSWRGYKDFDSICIVIYLGVDFNSPKITYD